MTQRTASALLALTSLTETKPPNAWGRKSDALPTITCHAGLWLGPVNTLIFLTPFTLPGLPYRHAVMQARPVRCSAQSKGFCSTTQPATQVVMLPTLNSAKDIAMSSSISTWPSGTSCRKRILPRHAMGFENLWYMQITQASLQKVFRLQLTAGRLTCGTAYLTPCHRTLCAHSWLKTVRLRFGLARCAAEAGFL